MNNTLINCQDLKKSYHDGSNEVSVLRGIDLNIERGDTIAMIGPSGSGKSTLLHLLGGLDTPTSGQVLLHGENWTGMSEKKRCLMRNRHLGFVYQFHHLLPEFSALENVAMPLWLGGMAIAEAKERAAEMLNKVGLAARVTHRPAALSGGERQRVAIARAMVHQPDCILADEPTGNLDQATAATIFDLMMALNEELHTALVVVTHDLHLAQRMGVQYHLHEGQL